MTRAEWTSRIFAAVVAAGALLLALTVAVSAFAQVDVGPATATGEVEVGGRAITGDWDSGKYEEYREQRPGVFGNAEVLVEGKEGKYFFEGQALDIAEDDQHYEIRIGRYGRYRLELEYDEMPHVFNNSARSLYTATGKGILDFPDSVQSAIQAAVGNPAKSAALQSALAGAFHVPLRFDLKTGRVGFFYRPLPELEFDLGYRIQQTEGTRPFSLGFGSPGGNFANIAGPIDERTHDVTVGAQYAREAWSLRLAYTLSFFENEIDTLVVDNPLQLSDGAFTATATGGSSTPGRGRITLPPDNSAHTLSLSGGLTLPTRFPARLSGTVSYGWRFQDDDFVPHTINSQIPTATLDLPKDNLDGEVNTLLATLRLTARPVPKLGVRTSYRFYDYDSNFSVIEFPAHVINDNSLVNEVRFTTPIEYTRHNADLGLSYQITRPLTGRLGFEWERWDRNDHREVTQTDEYTPRAGVDYRLARWALLRADYRFAVRQGNGYNTFAHLAHAVEPDELAGATPQAQSVLLRKYDEANRKRHQGDLALQLTPGDEVAVTLTGGYGLSDYDDSELGIRDQESWNTGADVSLRPLPWLGVSTFYAFEHSRTEQKSRWRPRTFTAPPTVRDDPLNEWMSTSTDIAHTLGVSTDIGLVKDRLDATLSYVIEDGKAKTRAAAVPGFTNATGASTPPDGGNAVNYPDIEDTFHRFIAALRYYVLRNLTLKAEYRYERLDMTNFKTDGLDVFMPSSNVNGSGGLSPSLDVFLADRTEDYDAHIFTVSLAYRF